jgi:N utilization substance protein A
MKSIVEQPDEILAVQPWIKPTFALLKHGAYLGNVTDRDQLFYEIIAKNITDALTGAVTPEQAAAAIQKQANEMDSGRKLFMEKLDVDEEIADLLIAEGFTSLEQVAYVPLEEMLEIESFDEDTVNELRTRAKDALLTMEIAHEESVAQVSQDLRDLEGLTTDLIAKLADSGVHTRDDLADLAIDELTEITGQSEDEAKAMIMKAREHWFANEAASAA